MANPAVLQEQPHRRQLKNLLKATTLLIFPSIWDASHASKLRLRKKPTQEESDDPKFVPLPKPIKFGDTITADHLSFGKRDQSQRGDRFALGVLDRYSGWIDCFPAATKDAESVKAAMQEFLRSDDGV